EMVTLLSPYLLSSQGDRMAMAHGVEGRFLFLDHRLFEFAAALPRASKLRILREKHILRRWAENVIPRDVVNRPKRPYRAPDVSAFSGGGEDRPQYIAERLSPDAVRRAGIFEPQAVTGLMRRVETGRATGTGESQALVAVLSTQLWYHQFFETAIVPPAFALERADVALHEAVPVEA